MKKITLLAFFLIITTNQYAQVAGLAFNQSSGTYTPITGGTTLASYTASTSGTTRMDDQIYNIADGTIPFTFTFNGTGYTGCNVSTNGFITFGTTAPTSTSYTPISATTAYGGAISAFGRDLEGGFVFAADRTSASNTLLNVTNAGSIQVGDFLDGTGIAAGTTVTAISGSTITMSAAATSTGTAGAVRAGGPNCNIQYVTEGTAPNRVFVIQYSNFKRFGTTLTTVQHMVLNFQIRLYETSNDVKIVYGNCSPGLTTFTTTNQVGLRGADATFATNVNNRQNTKATNDNWLNSAQGTLNTSGMLFNNVAPANVIASGLTYTWSVPVCNQPTGLASANLTSSSADLSWTAVSGAVGYEYVVNTTSTDPVGAGTATAITTYNATGLNPNTTYYLHLRTNCGSGSFSTWSTLSFTTLCAAISVLPWTENFDSLATVGTANFPGCWTKENGDWATSIANTHVTPKSGANFLRDSWSATNEYMWTPGFQLTAGTSYDFSTFVQGDDGSTWFVDMFYNTLANSVGATQLGTTYNPAGANSASFPPQAYVEMRRTFIPSTTGVYYFAIRVNEATGNPWYVAFDDFRLELTPSCSAPTGLAAANITTTTADLSWGAVTGAVNYEYVIDNVSTDPAGAGTTIATTTYNATSLTPNTTYYLHVRTNCGSTLSAWTTLNFTTPATPPANDDCVGATTLIPAADFATGAITATLVGATNSEVADPTIPAPGCATYVGHDVWFTTTVPASGSITIETGDSPSSAVTDTGMAVYTGTCGAMTLALCDDDSSLNGAFSLITLSGATTPAVNPNDVLYVRVWRYNSTSVTKNINAVGEFRIAAYDASLASSSFDFTGFKAYPNPVNDLFNLSYTKEISNVSIVNLLGQEVLSKKVNALNTSVDMSALSKGTYLIKVTSEDQVGTIKVVKE